VPRGHVQVEGGFSTTYSPLPRLDSPRSHGSTEYRSGHAAEYSRWTTGPETLIRIGLDKGFEFTIRIPDQAPDNFSHNVPGNVFQLGTKFELHRDEFFELAGSVAINVPFDSGFLESDANDFFPNAALTGSFQINERTWARAQIRTIFGPNEETWWADLTASAAIGVEATSVTRLYVGSEINTWGTSSRRDGMPVLLMTGGSFQPLDIVSIDARIGIGVTDAAPNSQMGLGMSVRI